MGHTQTSVRWAPAWILGALGLASAGCNRVVSSAAAQEVGPEATVVRTAPAEDTPVVRSLRATGLMRPKSQFELSFKVPGVVTAVLVEEGARVRRGQPLARIDATEVASGVQQARESVAKAERDLERARKLHASGAIPLIEVQNAETGAAVSQAGLAAASFNAARATLVAPDDGVVDSRRIEVGEVVSPGRPVFQLSGRSRGWIVKVGLPDREVLGIREGEPARVRVDAGDFGELRGHVREVSNSSSARTGTFEVEVAIDEAPDGLRSGLSAKVAIDRSERPAVHVPIAAIAGVSGSEGAVFVLDGERVKRVPVIVSGLVGNRALLSRGPSPGAMVVTEGAGKLADGSRVRLAAGDVK